MSRKTRSVTSREYKVMLQAKRFAGSKADILAAAQHFQDAFTQVVVTSVVTDQGGLLVKGGFERSEDEKQVMVDFFDTKDRRLQSSNFVFRRRQPIAGGPLELTLKRRHVDRFFVSASKTGGKTKFEEDIKATKAQAFISLHSLSGKVKDIDPDTRFNSLKDIREFFKPLKKELGMVYIGNEKLFRVCDFIAIQSVFEGFEIQISDQVRAECALIVWHQQDGNARLPAVAEFSFRYKDKEMGKQEPFTAEMATCCFEVLQSLRAEDSPVANWVDLTGPTKTAYAYGPSRA